MSCVALPIYAVSSGRSVHPDARLHGRTFYVCRANAGSRVLGPGIICARTGPLPAGSAMMAKRNGIQISLVFAPIRVGAPDHPSVQPGIPRCGKLARVTLHRIRTASARRRRKRPGRRMRDLYYPTRQAIPASIFQQIRALTLPTLGVSRCCTLLQGATGATREISDLAIHLGGGTTAALALCS